MNTSEFNLSELEMDSLISGKPTSQDVCPTTLKLFRAMKRIKQKLRIAARIILNSYTILQPPIRHLAKEAGAPQGLVDKVEESEGTDAKQGKLHLGA